MGRGGRRRFWLSAIAFGIVVVAIAALGWPGFLWLKAWVQDRPATADLPPGHVDDASRLNRTKVAEIWSIPAEPAAAEQQLRDLIARARSEGRRVAIGGARHTMGGHTIYPDGIVLDMLPFRRMTLDLDRRMLRVGAGARWSEVLPVLDAQGLSVAVMQSNNDFSVGGSISVNCHGWQHGHPPISSTVESLRLMKADGSVVTCSRSENPDLFALVLGGYGLFGVILDVELRVVPNERYRAETEVVAADAYPARFDERALTTDVGMVYGRLSVVPGDAFLREAILTCFRKIPCERKDVPALECPPYPTLRRQLFRAQIDSSAGKEVRWRLEKMLNEQVSKRDFSRNQLCHEGVAVYAEGNADRTDVLHEYFVPPDQMAAFLDRARKIVPEHGGDLLNVTIRDVAEDVDTFLRYADRHMFGFVMLFSQLRTPEADRRMEAMTRELVDAAIACGGRHYLPYRLHASKEQMLAAYPKLGAFFAQKRRFDPGEVFQNEFYRKYAAE